MCLYVCVKEDLISFFLLFLNESWVLLLYINGCKCTQELPHKIKGDSVCCFLSGYTRGKWLSWTTWPTRTGSTRTTWTAWCYQHTRGHSTHSRRERKHGSNSLCGKNSTLIFCSQETFSSLEFHPKGSSHDLETRTTCLCSKQWTLRPVILNFN